MSEALDRMVAAMRAEIERQAKLDTGGQGYVKEGDCGLLVVDTVLDLNLVARAGLEAIRTADAASLTAGEKAWRAAEGGKADDLVSRHTFAAMIDAILKEPEA